MLFEFIVPEDDSEFDARDIDINMLALVSGRERTLAEYTALLTHTRWEAGRAIPTPVHTIIEAQPRIEEV